MIKRYGFTAIVTFLVFILAGCGGKTVKTDFDSFLGRGAEKTVSYNCDYAKVAKGEFTKMWDYCEAPDNQDYVSYFIPPDIQSSSGYSAFLAANVFSLSRRGEDSSYKYYQVFAGNDLARLQKLDMKQVQPESFAVENDGKVFIAINKRDLLARVYIAPSYSLISFAPSKAQPDQLRDYSVSYQIMPYLFTIPYEDSMMGRYMGLPDYSVFGGSLSIAQKSDLNKYNVVLTDYWKKPGGFTSSAKVLSAEDFVFPQYSGARLLKSTEAGSPVPVKFALPPDGGGYLNDYLPPYQLTRIDIIDSNGKILKRFDSDDIYRTLISVNDWESLIYADNKTEDGVIIRYTHEAIEPRNVNFNKALSKRLGIDYVYSDIAPVINTDMKINNFFPIKDLPAVCIDKNALSAFLTQRTGQAEDAGKYLNLLNQAQSSRCTANERSMMYWLHDIFE